MAKFGLLVTSPVSKYKNIGDYMQSLAAKQFIGDKYCFVEKESISKFENEDEVKVIMNAWYMWHPENWPPQPCITPLLISMHITCLKAEGMLSEKGKEYLIKNGPVGCRDLATKEILEKAGVPAYFSACLTLTLGHSYEYDGERKGVIFVDPYIPPYKYIVDGKTILYPFNIIKSFWYYLKNRKKVNRLLKLNHFTHPKYKILRYYMASMFYESYSSMFDDDIIFSAEYYTHMVSVSDDDNNATLLAKAEKLLRRYSKAKLVVTSRIHCALPCTGVKTPVIFILNKDMESDKNMFGSPGRFGGLIDFFRVMVYDKDKLQSKDEGISNHEKIHNNTKIEPKDNWQEYSKKMIKKCMDFVKS